MTQTSDSQRSDTQASDTQARNTQAREREWEGTTQGSQGMHSSLIWLLGHVSPHLIYAFAAVFVVPVAIFKNPGGRIIYDYFRKRHGLSRLRSAWKTFVNHCLFSQVVIDRFAMFAGRRFTVDVVGGEHLDRLIEAPDGFVILSSHVGCYEIAGYSLELKNKTLNALVYGGEKASVMAGRAQMFGKTHVNMILTADDMSHLFEINKALADNQIVSLPADRMMGSDKGVTVSLLGAETRLPQGPFAVPAMRNANVLMVNVVKTSHSAYRVIIETVEYDKSAPRKTQMKQMADAYAAGLQRVLTQYPEQWFNFFDFWAQ